MIRQEPIYHAAAGDTKPPLEYQLTDVTDEAINVTDAAEVRFYAQHTTRSAPSVNTAVEIEDAQNGEVKYEFTEGDIPRPGDYYAEFVIHWSDGTRESVPALNRLILDVRGTTDRDADPEDLDELQDIQLGVVEAERVRVSESPEGPTDAVRLDDLDPYLTEDDIDLDEYLTENDLEGLTADDVGAPTQGEHDDHVGDTSNPHDVTAGQSGALPTSGGEVDGPFSTTEDIEAGEAFYQNYSDGDVLTLQVPGTILSNQPAYLLLGEWDGSNESTMGTVRGWRTGGSTGSGGILTVAASSDNSADWSGSFQRQATTSSTLPRLEFYHVEYDGTEYFAIELDVSNHHNYDSGLFFSGSVTDSSALRVVNPSTHGDDLDVIESIDSPARIETYAESVFEGDVDVRGDLEVSGSAPGGSDGGMWEEVATATDGDDSTALDIDVSIPDPGEYQQFWILGWINAPDRGQGEGGDVPYYIRISGFDESEYSYTQQDRGSDDWTGSDTQWENRVWRRYREPVSFIVMAQHEEFDSGNDDTQTFASITNHAHGSRRGLTYGRTERRMGTIDQIEMWTDSGDEFEGSFTIYGSGYGSSL